MEKGPIGGVMGFLFFTTIYYKQVKLMPRSDFKQLKKVLKRINVDVEIATHDME